MATVQVLPPSGVEFRYAKQVPVLAPGSLVIKPPSLHTPHVLVEGERDRARFTKLPHGPTNRKFNDIRVLGQALILPSSRSRAERKGSDLQARVNILLRSSQSSWPMLYTEVDPWGS